MTLEHKIVVWKISKLKDEEGKRKYVRAELIGKSKILETEYNTFLLERIYNFRLFSLQIEYS